MSFVFDINLFSSSLEPTAKRKRFARGSSGCGGKTSGRGHKGQRSRPGSYRKYSKLFITHLPKYGFRSPSSSKKNTLVLTVNNFINHLSKYLSNNYGITSLFIDFDLIGTLFKSNKFIDSFKIINSNVEVGSDNISFLKDTKITIDVKFTTSGSSKLLRDLGFDVRSI
jgi:hypothetical protein